MTLSKDPFRKDEELCHIEMPSLLSARYSVIDMILERLAERGCELDTFLDRLCMDEAITNAILHGNGEDPMKKVQVTVFCSEERWGFEVQDEGPGFDWEAQIRRTENGPDPDDPTGLGLAILNASGAEVQFLDGGRRVLLVKSRR